MGSQCLYVKFSSRNGRVWDWWAIIGIFVLVSFFLPLKVGSDSEETEAVQSEESQSIEQTAASATETPSVDTPELHATSLNADDAVHNDNPDGEVGDSALNSDVENVTDSALSSEAGDSALNSDVENITDSALSSEAEDSALNSDVENVTDSALSSEAEGNTTVSEVSLVRPKCDVGKGCDTLLHCFDFKTLPSNASIIPDPPQAVIVTPHQLESIVENQTMQNCCAVVLFYAPWCTFSVQFAQKFNALGRSFENLPILAVDMAENEPYKYILAYLPLVAFYYRGKTLFKFRLESSFEDLRDMISNVTGFTPLEVNLSDPINNYPVPTVRDTSDHLALSLAIWWVAFVALVYTMRSGLTGRCVHYLRTKLSRTKVD